MTFVYVVTHTHQGERIICDIYESRGSADHHIKASHQAWETWEYGTRTPKQWTACAFREEESHIQEWSVKP